MNKKTILLAVALSFPVPVLAMPGLDGNHMSPEHRLDRLEKELQLNPEQKAKVDEIFKEQHEKFRVIREESHARIKNVLNPEQIKKWDDMKQQRKEKRQQKPAKLQ